MKADGERPLRSFGGIRTGELLEPLLKPNASLPLRSPAPRSAGLRGPCEVPQPHRGQRKLHVRQCHAGQCAIGAAALPVLKMDFLVCLPRSVSTSRASTTPRTSTPAPKASSGRWARTIFQTTRSASRIRAVCRDLRGKGPLGAPKCDVFSSQYEQWSRDLPYLKQLGINAVRYVRARRITKTVFRRTYRFGPAQDLRRRPGQVARRLYEHDVSKW